jgi:hypothetical protein
MKILGTVEGFSKEELNINLQLIYSNCISEMKTIVEYIFEKAEDIEFEEANKVRKILKIINLF